jgi:hypothetical protein
MIKLSEKLLHLGLALLLAGTLLRVAGYHQERGFLQDILFLETGITPRAFLMASAAVGVFAIACGVVGIGKLLEKQVKESSKSD